MELGRVCNGGHGERGTAVARCAAPWLVVALLALGPGAALERPAAAAEHPAAPRVVWAGAGRLYIAWPDSGAIAPRMRVRVFERGREVAIGEVTSVLDGVLASVRLASGGLDPRARLERLEVRAEPAEPLAVAALRVGLPTAARAVLAIPCAGARLEPAALPRAYRAETLGEASFRLVAADSAAGPAAWPDTLLVRFYGDRADEQIALERGELDVAVFWPGEPSARLRDRASGFELLHGARARGALVARSDRADTALAARVAPDMAALNAGLFGGDLAPWGARGGGSVAPGPSPPARSGAGPLRYQVDERMPGSRTIGRFLNRNAGTARPSAGSVFVSYQDVPSDSPGTGGGIAGTPVLALRFPVLCSPSRVADVRALGADAFANLLTCGDDGRRP